MVVDDPPLQRDNNGIENQGQRNLEEEMVDTYDQNQEQKGDEDMVETDDHNQQQEKEEELVQNNDQDQPQGGNEELVDNINQNEQPEGDTKVVEMKNNGPLSPQNQNEREEEKEESQKESDELLEDEEEEEEEEDYTEHVDKFPPKGVSSTRVVLSTGPNMSQDEWKWLKNKKPLEDLKLMLSSKTSSENQQSASIASAGETIENSKEDLI